MKTDTHTKTQKTTKHLDGVEVKLKRSDFSQVYARIFVALNNEEGFFTFHAVLHRRTVRNVPSSSSALPHPSKYSKAVRIRQVADPSVGSMPSAIKQIVAESGWGRLYDGLPSILFRQISFGMMKFLVFDYFNGESWDECGWLFILRFISDLSSSGERYRWCCRPVFIMSGSVVIIRFGPTDGHQ